MEDMCSEIFAVQRKTTALCLSVRIAVAYTNILQYTVLIPDSVCQGFKLHSRRREHLEAQPWPEDLSVLYEEGPMRSELESDCSEGVSSGGNAAIHAQMCAIVDFYGIPDRQKVG